MTTAPSPQPIADNLFRVDDGLVVLLGTRRRSTGAIKFPRQVPEINGPAGDMDDIDLSTTGTLYTFTTQEFPPPLPYIGDTSRDGFTAYVVGLIELDEGVLVESLIVGADAGRLRIGQPMRTTSTAIVTTAGESLLTFAFRPQ